MIHHNSCLCSITHNQITMQKKTKTCSYHQGFKIDFLSTWLICSTKMIPWITWEMQTKRQTSNGSRWLQLYILHKTHSFLVFSRPISWEQNGTNPFFHNAPSRTSTPSVEFSMTLAHTRMPNWSCVATRDAKNCAEKTRRCLNKIFQSAKPLMHQGNKNHSITHRIHVCHIW